MTIRYTLLLPVLLCTVALPARAQGWEWQNPLPHGRHINDILFLGSGRAVAACDNGYIMVSGTEGQSWGTWRIPGSHTNNHRLARTGDGSLLMASGGGRIFRSTDAAASWTQAFDSGSPSQGYEAYDLVTLDHSALAVLGGTFIAASQDDGRTWSNIPVPIGSEIATSVALQSPTVWWVCGYRTAFRSSDAGRTWSAEPRIDAQGLNRLVFVDSLYGYQLRDGRLLRTLDGGDTWIEMNIFGFGTVTDLAAGPALGDAVFCLSQGRYLLNISTDAGGTWNIGLTESAFADGQTTSLTFADAHLGLVAGDGGRILRTSDGGITWSMVAGSGYIGTVVQALFTDTRHGVARTYTPTLLLTSDGGKHWSESIPAQNVTFQDVQASPSGKLFALGRTIDSRYHAYRSSDRGVNWQQLGEIPVSRDPWQPVGVHSINIASDDELWVGASYGIAYRSTNGGVQWDSLYVPDPDHDYSSGQRVFCFPSGARIYTRLYGLTYSSDGGATWDVREEGQYDRMLWDTQFVTPDDGFTLLGSKFARTRDGGRSWQRVGDLALQMMYFVDASHGAGLWVDPQEDNVAYVLRTSDAGDTWDSHRLGERVDWYSWFFLTPELGWAVGSNGEIRTTSNGGIADAADAALVEDFGIGAVYPHPFAPATQGGTTIPYMLATGGPTRLQLVDALGRTLAVLVDEVLPAGRHNVRLNASALPAGLPSGLYMLALQAGARRVTRPLLLVR